MDLQQPHRRSLYKEHKEVLSPSQHNRVNRQIQEANRQKKRKDLYQSSRNISPTPTPHKLVDDKENHPNQNCQKDLPLELNATTTLECDVSTVSNKSRTAKLICTARDPVKIKKQEAYILRFLEWKEKKKAMVEKQKLEANKKRPFVSAVGKDSGFGAKNKLLAAKTAAAPASATATTQNNQQASVPSFVPKGHNKEFNPPPGLKYPDEEMIKEKIKSRQSIYTIVPTPPRKTKPANQFPIARKALPPNLHLNSLTKKTPARTISNSNPMSSGSKIKSTSTVAVKSATKSNPNSANKPTKPLNNLMKNFEKTNSIENNNKIPTTTRNRGLQPKSLKMPPPPAAVKVPIKTRIAINNKKMDTNGPNIFINGVRVKGNATTTTNKMTNTKSRKSPLKQTQPQTQPQPQKNARLTQTMKAKKTKPPTNGPKATKLVSLMLQQADNKNQLVADMLVQTPRDFSNSNHFEEFVTSTKVKNPNQMLENPNGISPIEPIAKRSSTSAKRNILSDGSQKVSEKTEIEKTVKSESNGPLMTTTKSRFNFVRYSEVNVTFNDDEDEDDNDEEEEKENNKEKAKDKVIDNVTEKENKNDKENSFEKPLNSPEPKNGDLTLVHEKSLEGEKTPTKQQLTTLNCDDDDDKPVNYLSPYVSVSRGKVSLKKEKEKRNSIYLVSSPSNANDLEQQITTEEQHISSTMIAPKSPQYDPEVRRTLEAVRYYRKQLQDEIDRLHEECDLWEKYKDENSEKLQEANCDDMIDVAVGQTRLLTSKKFMQFKGLIDRCEAGATGINHRPYDGSEATKLITSTDLEGFWSMLGLQLDNLEKRFENLNRWKNNNWQDPEEVKPKALKAKNLTKVKKKSAAPAASAAAKARPNSALQQMLRKMQAEMRHKKANNLLATSDDVIVTTPSKVKDRKYFSPAATVVGIPLTASRRNSLLMARKNSQDSPNNRRMSIGGGGSAAKLRRNSQESPRRMSIAAKEKSPGINTRRATLHESVMRAAVEAQAANANGFNSPKISQGRKSILKTPGSARTNLRNVIFSQKCRVKKFNFIINDDGEGEDIKGDDENESMEEDMKQNTQESLMMEEETGRSPACGTYSLRNRKVRLRPSSEIVIPK